VLGQRGVSICLVYDFGNQLLFAVERVGGRGPRDFGARDSILRTVNDEKGKEGPDGVD